MPEIRRHLAALEAKGAVFRGRFSGAGAESWCDRYNLERIHRLTLEKVRAEIEPCEDHEYAAFVLRWHHIGGDGLPSGADGVAAVLDQLSGVALDTELWERANLPARVPDYRPEHLDLLCLSGQMVWVAGQRPRRPIRKCHRASRLSRAGGERRFRWQVRKTPVRKIQSNKSY